MGENDEVYKKFIEAWGVQAQLMMCIEEMSELTKELCKYTRYADFEPGRAEKIKQNIIEEIADVLITTDQMAMVFGREEVKKVCKEKIQRALKKLEK